MKLKTSVEVMSPELRELINKRAGEHCRKAAAIYLALERDCKRMKGDGYTRANLMAMLCHFGESLAKEIVGITEPPQ